MDIVDPRQLHTTNPLTSTSQRRWFHDRENSQRHSKCAWVYSSQSSQKPKIKQLDEGKNRWKSTFSLSPWPRFWKCSDPSEHSGHENKWGRREKSEKYMINRWRTAKARASASGVMNIEWDYGYYRPWSDNEWLVDKMIAMREETLIVQNEDITMQ